MDLLDALSIRYAKRYPALSNIMGVVPHFPISIRKEVITCCQLGIPETKAIDRIMQFIPSIRELRGSGSTRSGRAVLLSFLADFQDILQNRVARSIIWILCRCCPEPKEFDEEYEVRRATFEKEFSASQVLFREWSSFDYSLLSLDTTLTWFEWQPLASDIIHNLAWALGREKDWYPHVQRSKNVSQETAWNYLQHPMAEKKSLHEVTTCDLEVLYARTGYMTQGQCEIRTAWKFNELKPRYYYCQGGTDYFASRYMKPFAVLLMEAIPATKAQRRTNPEDYITALLDQEEVVAWDYEAFTSRLNDLRYFLHYIARGLESLHVNERFLIDYRDGRITRDPAEMLDEYNEICNCLSPFSLHRIMDDFGILDTDTASDRHQQNSGSLGVAGNIGFSTALHGFHVCGVCGKDKCVCVGDDALGIVPPYRRSELILHMVELGVLHPEKCSSIWVDDEGPIKFLKRGLYRTRNSYLWFDPLYNLPIPNYVTGQTYTRTSPPSFTYIDRVYKVTSTVSGLYLSLYRYQNAYYPITLDDLDMDILKVYLFACYQKLGLPREGALPGYPLNMDGGKRQRITFCIPPLPIEGKFDPREKDWLEFLFDRSSGPVLVPMFVDTSEKVEQKFPGDTEIQGMSRYLAMLEDLGLVKTVKIWEYAYLSDENRRRVRMLYNRVSGYSQAVHVTHIAPIPQKLLFRYSVPQEEVYSSGIAENI